MVVGKEFNILNVGSGSESFGDVRVDVSPRHLGRKHRIMPDVFADGQKLPFRDGAFSRAYSSHVIEHCPEPFKLVEEMARVSLESVEILFPIGDGFKRFVFLALSSGNVSMLSFGLQLRRVRSHLWIVNPRAVARKLASLGMGVKVGVRTRHLFQWVPVLSAQGKLRFIDRFTARLQINYEYVVIGIHNRD